MRLSLQLKFSGIILSALFISIGIITYYATIMFIQDKSNYIYEVSSLAARDRSVAISATLDHLREKMRIFARTYESSFVDAEAKKQLLEDFFRQYQEFLALSIYQEDGTAYHLFKSGKLDALSIGIPTLEKKLKDNGLKFEDVYANRASLWNATVDARLPAFAYATALPKDDRFGRQIVVGVVDIHELEPSGERRGSQEIFIVDNKGKVIYHPNVANMLSQEDFSRYEIVRSMFENAERVQAGTKEFTTPKGERMLGAFAILKGNQAGVVVQVPRDVAFLGAKMIIINALYVAAVILVIATLLSLFMAGSITRPLMELARATRRIAKGEFNLQMQSKTRDEIGDLARSFNRMGSELMNREQALKDANQKLIQSEKMGAFGQLGAGIAHEVKNPLAGILGYAQLAKKKVSEDDPIYKNLTIIEKETKRCKEIIENLLKFARQEKASFESIEINTVVRDALVLVEHQLTINKVKISRHISEDSTMVIGNTNQLQQVLMNLMINAQHAMEPNGGELHVTSGVTGGFAVIRLRDTGCGIPEEIRKKIFEPFFTTKPAGKGTGLGLSVSYGIIADHKGEIVIESEVGKGTEFIISLPIAKPGEQVKPESKPSSAKVEEARAHA